MGLTKRIRTNILIFIIIKLITNIISKNDFEFNSKDFVYSIYFSDIDLLSSLDFEKEMDRPHKIDMMILKIEKNDPIKESFDNKFNYYQHQKKSKTFLNLKLAKNYYDINFCVDEIDSSNKNQIFKDLFSMKSNKKKIKLVDFSHKDFINILKKNDFSIIDPIAYNDEKKASRYDKNINTQDTENDEDHTNQIEREFEKCFKKFEFLNDDSPRFNIQKSENFNLIKILNQTTLLQKDNLDYNHIFDDYVNLKLGNLLSKTKMFINQMINSDDQNIMIEINFKFDNNNLNEFLGETEESIESKDLNKFNLDKIFVYFREMPKLHLTPEVINLINSENKSALDENSISKNKFNNKDHYISLIQTHKNFENIFVDYKLLNKQVKYSKSFLDTKKPKLSTKSPVAHNNKTNPMIRSFSTLQRESLFHNRLNFEVNLDLYKNEINNSNNNNKICILVYHLLTEDTYIEKNELKSHLNSLFTDHEIYYIFSNEIDQEVSSDISKQYFMSFAICSSIESFSKKYTKENPQKTPIIKNSQLLEISYPIHFRYQPPVYSTYYQEVFLNLPSVDIIIQEDQKFSLEKSLINSKFFYENIDFRKTLSYKNNRKQILNSRKLFHLEIIYRLKYLNEKEKMFQNLFKIRHFIPVGRMEHLYYVMIITFIIALIGFFIIVFGIINNKIKEKIN
jgi:hypothetical protein